MKSAYSAGELMGALNVTGRAIRKRAAGESWEFREAVNPKGGGITKEYLSDSLPDDVQLAIRIHEQEQAARQLPALREAGIPPAITNGAEGNPLNDKEIHQALASARLVGLYREHCRKFGKWGAKVQAKQDFVHAYNLGERGTFPDLFRQTGATSWKTLERQRLELKRNNNDPLALVDRRGKHRKGRIAVTERQDEILKILAFSPNAPLASEVIRAARKRMRVEGIVCTVSDATLRRRVEHLQRTHYPEWVLYREGEKALNDKCSPHIQRDWDRVEVGDVVFADGHRINFEILNPWTGRPKRMTLIVWYDGKSNYPLGWEIMPEENTQAITSALYRAILNLGKMPKVLYMDNGKAFRGQYFNGAADLRQENFIGLFERLGMDTVFAWKYHAESKPLERWFGTLAEFERSALSYTGTNIESKPPRLKRNERIHRALHALVTGGRVPTIEETHRALADWIDEYAGRVQTGHLKGRCPRDVFLEGRGPGLSDAECREIRLLMSDVHVRSIHRDGIKMPWAESRYYHPALYGRRKQGAIVRYDWQKKESIWVYDLDGALICEATLRSPVHPVAAHLGTPEDVEELQRQIEEQRRLKKQTVGPARKFLEAVVMPEVKLRQEQIGFGPGSQPAEPTPANGNARLRLVDRPMSDAEKAEALREYEELAAIHEAERANAPQPDDVEPEPEPIREPSIWEKRQTMRELDRYEADLEGVAQGMLMPRAEKAWMRYFIETELYARHQGYFEEFEVKMALMYQGRHK